MTTITNNKGETQVLFADTHGELIHWNLGNPNKNK